MEYIPEPSADRAFSGLEFERPPDSDGNIKHLPDQEQLRNFYPAFLNTFRENVFGEMGTRPKLKDSSGILGIMVYGRPAKTANTIESTDIDICVVYDDEHFGPSYFSQVKEELQLVKEYLKSYSQIPYQPEIDGALLPASEFKKKMRQLSAMTQGSIEIVEIEEWINRTEDGSIPVYLLFDRKPQKFGLHKDNDGFITEAIQEAIDDPLDEKPDSLDPYKF